jgi:hypothetical protein
MNVIAALFQAALFVGVLTLALFYIDPSPALDGPSVSCRPGYEARGDDCVRRLP